MKLGGTDISKIYLGSTEVSKAYLGSVQVYEGVSPILPYDSKVDYLESTGTQYIDTGIMAGNSTKVECSANWTYVNVSGTNPTLYGSRSSSSSMYELCYGGSYAIYYQYGAKSPSVKSNSFFGSRKVFTTDANQFYIDGSLKITATAATFSNTYSLCLFCLNNQGTKERFVKAKLYYMKIWDGGTLVRNFIPVRIGQTGYLYDQVSGQLFGNSGTGSFGLGNDITN